MTGLQHPDCYARALGGCCREMSGEHYISKSVLQLVENRAGEKSKSVRAFGLSFQALGEEKTFGVGSLVGNILCKTHNRQLSPFDTVGKDMFLAVDALNGAAADPATPHRAIQIDGDRLERWMLKSMIGGLYCGAFRVTESDTMKGECPPLEFLQMLFEGAELPKKQGLYWLPPKAGEMITADQQVLRVSPLVSQGGRDVCGFRVWFFGFEFALLTAQIVSDVPTMFDTAHYRPSALSVIGSNVQIKFAWRGGAQSPVIQMQHHKQ
jgi:hypothetical protein